MSASFFILMGWNVWNWGVGGRGIEIGRCLLEEAVIGKYSTDTTQPLVPPNPPLLGPRSRKTRRRILLFLHVHHLLRHPLHHPHRARPNSLPPTRLHPHPRSHHHPHLRLRHNHRLRRPPHLHSFNPLFPNPTQTPPLHNPTRRLPNPGPPPPHPLHNLQNHRTMALVRLSAATGHKFARHAGEECRAE